MKNISKVFPVLGLAMLVLAANPASARADGSWSPIQLDAGSSPQVTAWYQAGLFTDGQNFMMDIQTAYANKMSDMCLQEVDMVPQEGPDIYSPQGPRKCIEKPSGSDLRITLPISLPGAGVAGSVWLKTGSDMASLWNVHLNAGWDEFSGNPTGVVTLEPGK